MFTLNQGYRTYTPLTRVSKTYTLNQGYKYIFPYPGNIFLTQEVYLLTRDEHNIYFLTQEISSLPRKFNLLTRDKHTNKTIDNFTKIFFQIGVVIIADEKSLSFVLFVIDHCESIITNRYTFDE